MSERRPKLAYRARKETANRRPRELRHAVLRECYYCGKFTGSPDRHGPGRCIGQLPHISDSKEAEMSVTEPSPGDREPLDPDEPRDEEATEAAQLDEEEGVQISIEDQLDQGEEGAGGEPVG